MKTIKHTAKVHFTSEQMYKLVNDIARYPEFLPWCKASKIIRQTAEHIEASLTVKTAGLEKSFTTRNALIENECMTLQLIEGPFKHFLGVWEFIPLGEQQCEVSFRMEFEFNSKLLAMVAEKVFIHIADTMVQAFVRRAEALYV